MKRILLSISILAFTNTGSSQQSDFGIAVSPAFVGTTSARVVLQPGVFYKINEKLSVLTDVALMVRRTKDPSSEDNRYFRIKPELRYNFSKPGAALITYAGFQLFYSYRKWNNTAGGYYFDEKLHEDSATSFTSATIKSPVMASSLQLGMVLNFSDRFGIDLFLGAGARVINTNYSDVVNSGKVYNIRPNCMIMFSPDPAYSVNGTITRFQLNGGIRCMFRF